jgi:protoporphyrinogen oxidase
VTTSTELPSSADAVVVGAGLAGLSAAVHLTRAGLEVVVLERSDAVGGRVRSDVVDGFVVDRGFQVIATAYPELDRLIDVNDLDLRPFARGVGVYGGGRVHRLLDPRDDTTALHESIVAPIGSWADRARLLAYAARLLSSDPQELLASEDRPAIESFRALGLSEVAINRLLRPFLRGVVLEDGLNTSRRFVDVAVRSMLLGPVAVPARGMQQLPDVIARLLTPGTVFTGADVTALTSEGVDVNGHHLVAPHVVVATDPPTAQKLLRTVTAPPMNGVTTLFHASDSSPRGDALLLVDGERDLITNTLVLTDAAPEYAADGRALIATSVLGTEQADARLDDRVRGRLADLYGTDTSTWELIATRAIPHALPAMPAPHDFQRDVRVGPGRYVAGDHRDSGSIQGALVSGRRVAHAVLGNISTEGSSSTRV